MHLLFIAKATDTRISMFKRISTNMYHRKSIFGSEIILVIDTSTIRLASQVPSTSREKRRALPPKREGMCSASIVMKKIEKIYLAITICKNVFKH